MTEDERALLVQTAQYVNQLFEDRNGYAVNPGLPWPHRYSALAADPEAGNLIPGTGGARKRRFAGRGKGKSGGYRTVTYFGGKDVPVVALAIINKGQRANISAADRDVLRKELAGFADDYRAGVRKRVTEIKRSRL